MDQLIRWGRDAFLLAVAAGVPASILWAALARARTPRMGRRAAVMASALDAGLVLSLAVIAVVGLRPGMGQIEGWVQWNFVPFLDLMRSLDEAPWRQQIAILNLIGNVLFFAPWGFMFALRFPRTGWAALLGATLSLSLAIEVAQAIMATGRLSDSTDVLMNMIGGAVGFAIGHWAANRAVWARNP